MHVHTYVTIIYNICHLHEFYSILDHISKSRDTLNSLTRLKIIQVGFCVESFPFFFHYAMKEKSRIKKLFLL